MTSVQLLTYNLFIRPPGVKNQHNDFKTERLEYFYLKIQNFDIICLQEIYEKFSFRKAKLIERAMNRGFLWFSSCPNPSFCFQLQQLDAGLLTLSKYPITESRFEAFQHSFEIDCIANKGVLYSQIMVENTRLHIFNTHLQSTYFNQDPKNQLLCQKARMNQVIQIKDFIQFCKIKYQFESQDLFYLVGDFNIDARDSQKYAFQIDNQTCLSTEYDILCQILNNETFRIQDLIRQSLGKSPVTFGDTHIKQGKELPTDPILYLQEDFCRKMCIDYVLQIQPTFQDNQLIQKHTKKDSHVTIEKFQVDDHRFSYVSDHYGVLLNLKL